MLKSEVEIGATYLMKVSGKLTKVILTDSSTGYNGRSRWGGINLSTGRAVIVKSAAKLRSKVLDPDRLSDSYCLVCEERMMVSEVADAIEDNHGLCHTCRRR